MPADTRSAVAFPCKQANGLRHKQQIWDRLCRGPATATQLMAWLYQTHPQDAPTNPRTIKVQVSQMNVQLRRYGQPFRIRSDGRGGGLEMPYRIMASWAGRNDRF